MTEAVSDRNVSGCVFCSIVSENAENKILWQDEELAVIADHRPASDHHYLVLTKRHIPDVRSLVNGSENDKLIILKTFEAAKTFIANQVPELKNAG